jgi:hypothetical protein
MKCSHGGTCADRTRKGSAMTDILAQVESHLKIWGLADAEQRAAGG